MCSGGVTTELPNEVGMSHILWQFPPASVVYSRCYLAFHVPYAQFHCGLQHMHMEFVVKAVKCTAEQRCFLADSSAWKAAVTYVKWVLHGTVQWHTGQGGSILAGALCRIQSCSNIVLTVTS